MPRREDEYWKNDQESVRWCTVHQRYYRIDVGCQLCFLDTQARLPISNVEVIVISCPNCEKQSLWWNPQANEYECLNPNCNFRYTSDLVEIPPELIPVDQILSFDITKKINGLTNPLLLSAKMFLADEISIINRRYDIDRHNCSHFSKELQEAATERGIRCGYVSIHFEQSRAGHAIIAFETDYGLTFFESQNGNTVDAIIGKTYSEQLEGVPKGDVIRYIEISWNDGEIQLIDK